MKQATRTEVANKEGNNKERKVQYCILNGEKVTYGNDVGRLRETNGEEDEQNKE